MELPLAQAAQHLKLSVDRARRLVIRGALDGRFDAAAGRWFVTLPENDEAEQLK